MIIDIDDELNWFVEICKNVSLKKLMALILLKKKPIFIGGCGRSGTSLLLSILGAHPNIYGISEETNIFGYKRKFRAPFLNRMNNLRKLWPHLLKDQKILSANRWCEKTPRNIRYIPQISDEFKGDFHFINIVRDGRDVVTSIHPLTNEYHVSIERWIFDVNEGLKNSLNKNVYTIKYEDIINDFSGSVRRLLVFLGEDYVGSMDNFHLYSNVRTHKAFNEGVVKNITSASIGKWKDEKHKIRIREFYASSEASELLKKLGYDISLD